MTEPRLRLAIFDVDGTLVDSQAAIVGAMTSAFGAEGLAAPRRADILAIVGLSLDLAVSRLVPNQPDGVRARLVGGYKDAYHAHRATNGAAAGSPLFPGARDMLATLAARDDILLGIATGKSRRGLDALIEAHGLENVFVTRQVADDHPSKPHPSMVLAALSETGVSAGDAAMIGDTSFDMDMAAAAGVAGIGVSWGYHAPGQVSSRAARMIDRFDALPGALNDLWAALT